MERLPQTLVQLIRVLERLPGIGPKTAARLTFYLFQTPPHFVDEFIKGLRDLKEKLGNCSVCHNIDETDPCRICSQAQRDRSLICVVERPLDVVAIEATRSFSGFYHVLGGVINPLIHVGPDDLQISSLLKRCSSKEVKEIILATNPTMEGEATALHIKKGLEKINKDLKITRIGHGLPMGADLDYADPGTLKEALKGRQVFS
ncbi:recombination protein RecR [Candidatus Shapirobacteria bacterium]|nr:recombination protein RecR [Candidatus Shapirobacteria bacterium]